MSLGSTAYCDKKDCHSHESYIREASMPPGWIEVNWWGHEGAKVLHFCSWDCVLFFAGEQEPIEVVPFVDPS